MQRSNRLARLLQMFVQLFGSLEGEIKKCLCETPRLRAAVNNMESLS
jgi:hypothetical protein